MPDDQQAPWEKYSAPADQGPWAKYAAPNPPAAAPDQPAPTPLQRFSEVTLGTQHPVDDTMAALGQWRAHPVQSALTTAKQTAMVIPNMASSILHPIDTLRSMSGGNQFSEDVGRGHYGNAAADVAGGVANALPLLLGGEPVGDTAAGALSRIGEAVPSKADIGSSLRELPNKVGAPGKLKPLTKVGSSVAGATVGGLGGFAGLGPYGAGGGILAGWRAGPQIADALIPANPGIPTNLLSEGERIARTKPWALPTAGETIDKLPPWGMVPENERVARLKPWETQPEPAVPISQGPNYETVAKINAVKSDIRSGLKPPPEPKPGKPNFAPLGGTSTLGTVGSNFELPPPSSGTLSATSPGAPPALGRVEPLPTGRIVSPDSPPPHIEGSFWSFPKEQLGRAVLAGDRDAAVVYKQRFGELPAGSRYVTDVGDRPNRGIYRSSK